MRDALGEGTHLGYCTNVHSGRTWAEVLQNLDTHAASVRKRVCTDGRMGIGLWLPASVAYEALAERRGRFLRDWLAERGLYVFTINGFPYGDFHARVVKRGVYRPTWADMTRFAYTKALAWLLADMLPEGTEGSISTLPLFWDGFPRRRPDERVHETCARWLERAAGMLLEIEETRGIRIHLDLEPEPGCALTTSDDVVRYFNRYLLSNAERNGRYLRVCHDVCHAAVMFEDQREVFDRYREAGVSVGKVQISSAIRSWGALAGGLGAFSEERFLHQTTVRTAEGLEAWDDLPNALEHASRDEDSEWRVHFHAPVYAESLGPLGTTRDEIAPAVAAALDAGVEHFEVETYAWDVLPPEHRAETLAEGIARELAWVVRACGKEAG